MQTAVAKKTRKIGFTHIYSWANIMQTRCKCVANMVNAVFTSLLHRACKCVSKYGIYHVCHTFAPRLHHICSWVNVSKSNFSCSVYGLISKLMVTLVKEEMYRSNLQLLKRQKVTTSLSLMRFHLKKGVNFISTMLLIHTSLACFADRRYPTLTPFPPPSRFLKLKQLTMQASWIKWFLVQVYSFTTIYLSIALKLWVINCKITISINLSVFSHKYA